MIRPLLSLLLFLTFVLSAPGELVVRDPVLGFGGVFLPDRFNLVSVEVQNTGAQPFEGRISLEDGGVSGGTVPYEQALFLSPGASRWVQFYPFVSGYQRWSLSWRDKAGHGDSAPLRSDENVKAGGPVTVIFNAPDAPRSQQSRLRPFLENLFPPAVTATEGLHAVVLDHVPRWDALRRQAFRDWVYRGGLLHLLPGVDGKYPEFADELAPLNITAEKGHFGAGRIIRHTQTRSEIEERMLETDPVLLSDGKGYMQGISDLIVNRLSDITRPNISWGLIYMLTIVYVVLIGPVFYLQRKRDYRVMLAGFAVTVALFAWLFTAVGRRGYGEKQIVHSVGFAESLGGNRYLATQWMHAFATSSDRYRFQFPGPGNAYAALASSGTVKARVINGADAAMEADIPLFSGRPLIHSGVLTGDDTSVEIVEWKTRTGQSPNDIESGRLESFRIKPNTNFPKAVESMVVLYRERVYTMALTEGMWVAESPSASKDLAASFTEKSLDQIGYYGGNNDVDFAAPPEVRLKKRLGDLDMLFKGQLTGAVAYTRQRITRPAMDADTARLFIYTRTPDAFVVPGKNFQFGGGYILYAQTLHRP